MREDRAASAASEVPVSVLVARIRENKEREQNYRVAPPPIHRARLQTHTHFFEYICEIDWSGNIGDGRKSDVQFIRGLQHISQRHREISGIVLQF